MVSAGSEMTADLKTQHNLKLTGAGQQQKQKTGFFSQECRSVCRLCPKHSERFEQDFNQKR
jgi:hypothetical protein